MTRGACRILGTGDSQNRAENHAYGIPFPPVAERVAVLADCCRRLADAGVPTWCGGLSPMVRRVAAEAADGWNGWGLSTIDWALAAAEARAFAADAGRPAEIDCTWGGQVLVAMTDAALDDKRRRYGDRPGLVAGTVRELAEHLRRLAGDG